MNATASSPLVPRIAVVLLLMAAVSSTVHAQTLGGSDDNQFYSMDPGMPFNGLGDGWNRGMSITDLSVIDGNWTMAMTADNLLHASAIGQDVKIANSWEEATAAIEAKWNEGYRITGWTYENSAYAIVFSSNINYGEQKYDFKGDYAEFLDLLDAEVRAGWSVTEIFRDNADWVATFTKGSGTPGAGQYAREVSTCSDLSSAGDPVQLIAQGEGRAIAVFGSRSDWHYSYSTQTIGTHATLDDLGGFIADQKRSGYLITSIAHLGGQWCAAASKGVASNSGNLREQGGGELENCNACDFLEKLAGRTCC